MGRGWKDELLAKLTQKLGPKQGTLLYKKYESSFPTSYTEDCSTSTAVSDILQMEKLATNHPLEIDLYQKRDDADYPLHIRLFQFEQPIPLSDILPMLEYMDLRTFNEHPYEINLGKTKIWISDFSVTYPHNVALDIKAVTDLFEDALIHTRFGTNENDGFNKLVLGAQLSWREITIIRAYAKYLQQTGFLFSQAYIERTVSLHPDITKNLVMLFVAMHNPQQKAREKTIEKINTEIQQQLESVISLDEDRILRRIWDVMKATLRTNYFQNINGQPKDYLSFKLCSEQVPELPLPRPLYEIFVYSPRFEGIHLRSAKVARGGIRWSDRREDFRTEVLGLMKAQKVKNSVIVPSGAKGGFVLKKLPPLTTREIIQREVIYCYKSFIRGLLDLTDNIKNKKIIRPPNVVCYDDQDPYLVVAADKGTATFSDTANSISKEYDFWLGDAFASGGSAGYDHKKMGITARGAWESIKRHFRELNIDIEKTEFTTIGIGDMSGDVFGNGMLYTKNIKLIAAFDHRHIFLDPNPNAEKTFAERLRLFNLPTSSWDDFNKNLISTGGGIYSRSNKSISLSPEIKKALDIQENSLTPNELIRAILRAPVDLLFNGGIGTYVKASTETHADVGDKTNEFCRINGDELRCRIVGEGGNLGFTQLGRVEYALKDGLINTDFIDNSAGVDCSDHEVNIKILLNKEVTAGHLTEKQRNQFLAKMTNEVAQLVLRDNYNQALVMSFSAVNSTRYTNLYESFIKDLEVTGTIDRAVEFLPDEKKLNERQSLGIGLTRPELAVLLAYAKIHIKNELLKSNIPDDPFFDVIIETAFPETLNKRYREALKDHSLRREIIATQLSNQIINAMGITFAYRLQVETGASIAEIVRAYYIASHVYQVAQFQKTIDSLDFKIPVKQQYDLLHQVRRLLNLATRWFLRANRLQSDLGKTVKHYADSIQKLMDYVPILMVGATKEYLEKITNEFIQAGLPKEIATRVAVSRALYISLNITEVSTQYKFDLVKTAKVYFDVGSLFSLVWFRDQIANDSRDGHWNTLARLALRDELDAIQRRLTVIIINCNKKENNMDKLIEQWRMQNQHTIERWEKILRMLHASNSVEYVMFFIALRELADLLQGCE
jgi:glutamate dehydrogenase